MINEPQGKSNTERHGQNDSSGTVANAVQGRRGKFNAVLNCTQKPSGFFQSWKNILTWLEEMQVRESVQL